MRLKNKVALITGGSSGIGLATARRFIEEGASVTITGRGQKALDEATLALGPQSLGISADATDPAALVRAVEATIARFGQLDIVFANAGIAGGTPIADGSFDEFDRIIRTNIHGPFFTLQAALPHLKAGASVIFNGSVHAVLGIPGASAYAGSKGAIRSMVRVLASELAPRGIRVNMVVPGATRTPIWAARAPTPEAMEKLEAGFIRGIPLGDFAEAVDVANAALFLASDESRSVDAAEIVVDGGSTGAPMGAPIYR